MKKRYFSLLLFFILCLKPALTLAQKTVADSLAQRLTALSARKDTTYLLIQCKLAAAQLAYNPLLKAIEQVARDDMGREALQEALKGIKFDVTADEKGSIFEFKDGLLHLCARLMGSISYSPTYQQIAGKLEKGLYLMDNVE